jgi:hypothetical protein
MGDEQGPLGFAIIVALGVAGAGALLGSRYKKGN